MPNSSTKYYELYSTKQIYCAAFDHSKNFSVVIYAVMRSFSFPYSAPGKLFQVSTTYFIFQLSECFPWIHFCVCSLYYFPKTKNLPRKTNKLRHPLRRHTNHNNSMQLQVPSPPPSPAPGMGKMHAVFRINKVSIVEINADEIHSNTT